MKRKLVSWLKRRFALYDIDDVKWAFNNCGDAKDRSDMEWRVVTLLERIQGACK